MTAPGREISMAMTAESRRGDFATGLCLDIECAGEVFACYFPYSADDGIE